MNVDEEKEEMSGEEKVFFYSGKRMGKISVLLLQGILTCFLGLHCIRSVCHGGSELWTKLSN